MSIWNDPPERLTRVWLLCFRVPDVCSTKLPRGDFQDDEQLLAV